MFINHRHGSQTCHTIGIREEKLFKNNREEKDKENLLLRNTKCQQEIQLQLDAHQLMTQERKKRKKILTQQINLKMTKWRMKR